MFWFANNGETVVFAEYSILVFQHKTTTTTTTTTQTTCDGNITGGLQHADAVSDDPAAAAAAHQHLHHCLIGHHQGKDLTL